MTLSDLMNNWKDISYARKISAAKKVIEYLEQPFQKDEDMLAQILDCAYLEEQNDYFGTEGLSV